MKDRLLILNFHGIGCPPRDFWPNEQKYWVDRPFFEAVLDRIKDRSDTLVTFDDSNSTDWEVALPALLARGIRAHFYVVCDFLGQKGFLTKTAVQELHRAGMTIGNHGRLHRTWRQCSDQELADELTTGRNCLEDLISDKVRFAACPNGSYDRRVLGRLRQCGYERVYTSDEGWTCRRQWLQARNSMVSRYTLDHIDRLLRQRSFGWKSLTQGCKRLIKQWR